MVYLHFEQQKAIASFTNIVFEKMLNEFYISEKIVNIGVTLIII